MKYFTVGPTQPYPTLKTLLDDAWAQDIVSLSHRSETFYQLFRDTRATLIELLRTPTDRQLFVAGSATEWMERAVQNLCAHQSLHLVSGTFAERFYTFSLEMNKESIKLLQKPDGSFNLGEIPDGFQPELIALTHNETSNGTQLSPEIFAEVRRSFPDALIAVDVVSSAPVYPDTFAEADMLFFSVQKGFGLPAGLGVALVSPRAIEKSAQVAGQGMYTGGFHSLAHLAKDGKSDRTPETPNVLGIYLLHAVARDMLARGIATLRKDTEDKAAMIYDALAHAPDIELEAFDPVYRSQTTIVAATPGGSKSIIERLKGEGLLIHTGYGERKDTHIRIANFTAHTLESVEALCALVRS